MVVNKLFLIKKNIYFCVLFRMLGLLSIPIITIEDINIIGLFFPILLTTKTGKIFGYNLNTFIFAELRNNRKVSSFASICIEINIL